MLKAKIGNKPKLSQGDVLKDVEYIEYVTEKDGNIEISKIIFPLAIILTQDCDLEQDFKFRWSSNSNSKTEDKWLMSVIMAPLYNLEHVFAGEHLSELKMTMETINRKKSPGKYLLQNERPRYHYLNFPEKLGIAPSVIDFKHYFSANVSLLKKHKRHNFICQIGNLY